MTNRIHRFCVGLNYHLNLSLIIPTDPCNSKRIRVCSPNPMSEMENKKKKKEKSTILILIERYIALTKFQEKSMK